MMTVIFKINLFLTVRGPCCREGFSPVVYGLFIAVASLVAEQGPQGEQAAVGRGTRARSLCPRGSTARVQ